MAKNIAVPDIGDFKDVEIIEVLVKPGDTIKKNDPIVTLESDKSSVEVPSPYEGKISKLKVKIGDKVSEGSVLATLEGENEKKEETIAPTIEIKKVQKEIIPKTERTNETKSTCHKVMQGSKQRKSTREGFFWGLRAIWRVFLEILPL